MNMMKTQKAFTLLELLVVMTIIGMLAAMTVPAVNMVRSAARKTQCANHLKQFGTAFSAFEASNGGYPPVRSSDPRGGWSLALLPYMEMKNIYAQFDDANIFSQGKANQMLMRKRIPIFQCPATPDPDRLQYLDSGDGTAKVADNTGISTSGYAVGSCTDYYVHDDGILLPDKKSDGGSRLLQNVLAAKDTKTPYVSIPDGLSNTIILDEMAGRPVRWAAGKLDINYTGGSASVAGECGNRPLVCSWGGAASTKLTAWDVKGQNPFSTSNFNKSSFQKVVNATNDGVYSFHPSGANALFLDNTVRFINEAIIPEVYLTFSAKDSKAIYTHSDLEVRDLTALYPDGDDPTGLGRF
ncbi:MAG: DUF1559 domain-containing protein [Planctomycetia bacterium]|nr:DUF1559 domain-containing protein [Planctomycetia bacterium]